MNGAWLGAVAKGIVVGIGLALAIGVWNMSDSLTVLATEFKGFAKQVGDHEERIRSLEFRSSRQ